MIKSDRASNSKAFHYGKAVCIAQGVLLVAMRPDYRDSPLLVNPPKPDHLILVSCEFIQKPEGDFPPRPRTMEQKRMRFKDDSDRSEKTPSLLLGTREEFLSRLMIVVVAHDMSEKTAGVDKDALHRARLDA